MNQMNRFAPTLGLLLVLAQTLFSSNLQDCWQLILKNELDQAKNCLQEQLKSNPKNLDAYFTKAYLHNLLEENSEVKIFSDNTSSPSPAVAPYLFAHWNKEYFINNYSGMDKKLMNYVKDLAETEGINHSIRSNALYALAIYEQNNQDFAARNKYGAQILSIKDFQLVGPFDNLSQSGFNKQHEPLLHPEPNYEFTSKEGAKIKWFDPKPANIDAFLDIGNFFDAKEAVVFAQTFIDSEIDQDVVLTLGGGGNYKVYVNDGLCFKQAEYTYTPLHCFQFKSRLMKGTNRVLIQLGYNKNKVFPFIGLHVLDMKLNSIQNLKYHSNYKNYPNQSKNNTIVNISHFAIDYFLNQLKLNPNSYIAKLHLIDSYLRIYKIKEARTIVDDLIQKNPDCALFRMMYILVLQKSENRTELSSQIEHFKTSYKDLYLAKTIEIARLKENDNFIDLEVALNELKSKFGEDEYYLKNYILLLSEQNKYEELTKAVESAAKKYPNNKDFAIYQFNIIKNVYKNYNSARAFLLKYLNNNFDYKLSLSLAEEDFKVGNDAGAIQILEKLTKQFPYEIGAFSKLIDYYYGIKNYNAALRYNKECLDFMPYGAGIWLDRGHIYSQMNKKEDAIQCFEQASAHRVNYYEARNKIRELKNKADLWKSFKSEDPYTLFKNRPKPNLDHNSEYILDSKKVVVHEKGGSEFKVENITLINTKDGLERNKEVYIDVNYNTQSLTIIKAEVLKKNGAQIPAESSDNHIVFTNLEVGDGIHYEYKISNYYYGRLANEYWDRFLFNSAVPVFKTDYQVLVPSKTKINYKMEQFSMEPVIEKFDDDYMLYSWSMQNLEPVKIEDYMPSFYDIGKVLHISTMNDWSVIGEWYKDLANVNTEWNSELKSIYDQLFPSGKKYESEEIARKIYDYISKNISYSSVSFRQSAFVPQKPWTVVNTKLGDCKDLSSLFVNLAKMAGLKSNLVLVNTKDNGQKVNQLPSIDFNHCIVKLNLNDKPTYLELTDNNLKFAALPNQLMGSSALLIPGQEDANASNKIETISRGFSVPDTRYYKVTVNPDKKNLNIEVSAKYDGAIASSLKSYYKDKSIEDLNDMFQKDLNSKFNNPTELDSLKITELENTEQAIELKYKFKVLNEVMTVGSLNAFKIPFLDHFVRSEAFSKPSRIHDIAYWRYEDSDHYENDFTIYPAAGKSFSELPKNGNLSFRNTNYSLTISKNQDGSLQVKRKITVDRSDIQSSQYTEFKKFVDSIHEIESQQIVMK